jgi:uncharacterized membrane protein
VHTRCMDTLITILIIVVVVALILAVARRF